MTWVGIKDSMKKYCEKFFNAVEKWRNYESTEILQNRILLVATLCKIFHEDVYDESVITYELDIQTDTSQESINDILLPEYFSKAKNDIEAFQEAKRLVLDERAFKNVGFYFQENLLKALAGWSPEMLSKSNKNTRKHLIDCTMLLFRLPESVGFVSIKRTCYHANTNSSESKIIPLVELNTAQLENENDKDHPPTGLYKFLFKTRRKDYASEPKPKKRSISSIIKVTDAADSTIIVDGESNESFQSKESHITSSSSSSSSGSSQKKQKLSQDGKDFVGLKVLQYFVTGKGLKKKQTLFIGEVKKYLKETSSGAKDEMWHIVWEDGDECDYDKKELLKGRKDWLAHTNNNTGTSNKKNKNNRMKL